MILHKKILETCFITWSNQWLQTLKKQKVQGSISSLQKVKSLSGRWFSVRTENVEKLITGNSVERNCIFLSNRKHYRVLSVFKKSYNNWRHERRGDKNDKMKVHLQLLDNYHCRYHAHEIYTYIYSDSKNLGIYIGHALSINK